MSIHIQQHLLLFAIITIISLSVFWLTWQERQQADPDIGKDWWAVSFVDPTDASLDVQIENHSNAGMFHIALVQNKQELQAQDLEIPKGNSATVTFSDVVVSPGKIEVRTTSGSENKTLSKWKE